MVKVDSGLASGSCGMTHTEDAEEDINLRGRFHVKRMMARACATNSNLEAKRRSIISAADGDVSRWVAAVR